MVSEHRRSAVWLICLAATAIAPGRSNVRAVSQNGIPSLLPTAVDDEKGFEKCWIGLVKLMSSHVSGSFLFSTGPNHGVGGSFTKPVEHYAKSRSPRVFRLFCSIAWTLRQMSSVRDRHPPCGRPLARVR